MEKTQTCKVRNDMKIMTLKQNNYLKNIGRGHFENLYANKFEN